MIILTLFILAAETAAPAADSASKKFTVDLNYIWFILGVLILAVCAALILMSKQREEVQLTEGKRADANEKLVKTRDVELKDCVDKVTELEINLARMTLEYKTVVGIKIEDLVKHWNNKIEDDAKRENVEQENRKLRKRLEDLL